LTSPTLWECLKCGLRHHGLPVRCPTCGGRSFRRVAVAELIAATPYQECPHCGETLFREPGRVYCENCGRWWEQAEDAPEVPLTFPVLAGVPCPAEKT